MKTVNLCLTSIGVALVLTSCCAETLAETDHSRACRLYGVAIADADRRCGGDCQEGCELWVWGYCLEYTEPEHVAQVNTCRQLAESIDCGEFNERYWLPACEWSTPH